MKNFINKEANPSTLAMYCGGKNQEPKLQQSSKTRRKNKKNATKPHSKQGEYVRKNQNIVVLQAPHHVEHGNHKNVKSVFNGTNVACLDYKKIKILFY